MKYNTFLIYKHPSFAVVCNACNKIIQDISEQIKAGQQIAADELTVKAYKMSMSTLTTLANNSNAT